MGEFKLEFSSATIPYSKNSQVLQSAGSNRAFAISNKTLYEFEFNENDQPIIRTNQDKAYPFEDGAKLIYVEPIDDEKTAIIVKVGQGIHIYVHSKDTVHLAVEDDQFHDALDWHKPENGIHFGHFYHDRKILGLMSSHVSSGTKFFAIFKDVLLAGDFPIYPLETNVEQLETHSPNSAVRMLGNLNRNSNDYVLSRNRDGISCFQFNEANGIDFVMKIPHAGGGALNGDGLFFTDLSHQKYNEVVHLNSSGLFVYQYDRGNYKFLLYNPFFAEAKGWTPRHTETVRFFDIDRDGLTDMVFTGPKGIAALTYDQYSNSWNDLIVTSYIAPGMRHAQLMQVITTSDGDYIYVHIDDSIHWAKLVQQPLLPPRKVPLPSPSDKVAARSSMTPPQAANPKSFEPLSLLRDMSIWSDILNCIGQNTGKPKFSLPLINLPDLSLKLVMFYDATRTASDVLGVGWSMPLNLIVMDDQGSIFDEDKVYVIAFQDAMHTLKHLPMESNANIRTYTLPSRNGSPKFRAKFNTDDDRWVVDLGTGIKQSYGWMQSTKTGAVSKDIVWKNWHGAGFDRGDQLERSRMWYLAEVRGERDNALLEFFYDTDTVTVESGSTYTKAVYINRSRDFQGNEIKFRYQEKEANEYRRYDLQDQGGNFNWEPVQTRYLTGYTFRTPSRGKQEVSLGYRTTNGQRLLTEIRQAEDVIDSPVARFEYQIFSTGKCSLKNAHLPYGVEVAFTYAAVGERTRSNELKRLEVFNDYKVTIGEAFVLVSYINGKPPGQVVLRMFNRGMTEEMYTSHSSVRVTTKGRWPLLGEHASTVAHEVIQGDDYFGVVLFYAVTKRLCLFGREAESENWVKKTDCHEYGEEAVINAGRDFCLVTNPGKIVEIFEWKSTPGTWNRRTIIANAATVAIAVHQSKFVTYDNHTLSLGYKSNNGTWIHKPLLEIDSCLSNTEATMKRFNLKTNDHKLIAAAFRNNVVKFNHNLVALKCLNINGHQLESVVTLYTIDRLKKISGEQKFTIKQDDLNTFVSSEEENPDGNYFKFKYEIKPNGDIFIRLAGFRGPLFERAQTDAQKSEVAKHMEKAINSPSKRFFLDIQNYFMSFSDKVLMLNDQKLTFGGATWHRTNLTDKERNRDSFSIPLGDKFTLDKADKEAAIKLLKKSSRQTVAELPVDLSDLRIFYPVYLATQAKGVPVRLMEFDDMTVRESLLSSSETLSPFSNPMMVITQEGGDGTEKRKTLIFREQYGINKFLPNHVVREVAVYFDSDRKKRVTGYEYDAEHSELEGSNVVYSKLAVIPANDKNSYGWMVQSLTEDTTSKAYDSRGQPVRYIPVKKQQPKEEETEEEEALRRATTIYDKSGRLEIAQCAPFRPADDAVGYYGFEDYESKVIGKSKQWQFKASNVIRNGFSLTGKNYLHEQTEPIEGVFQPLDQNAEYIASSWIRLHNVTTVPQIGEVTPYLKAIVLTATDQEVVSLLSEVKFRIDDWIYLELIVDIPFAKTSAKNGLQDNLKIAIRVGPTSITPVDIDHVRFAPLISDFNVNIFDETTNSNTAVITPSGSIHRRIYDVYNSVVAKINEQNQIDELTVYTKAGAMSKPPRCTVNVQPEMGFYEQFAPFSFVNRWKVTTTSPWRIASYQLEHNGGQGNSLELSTPDVATAAYGFRMLYYLSGGSASFTINDLVALSKNATHCKMKVGTTSQSIPPEGEILFVKEQDRLLVWIDGSLYIDEVTDGLDKPLKFTMNGTVTISDLMVFSKASVKVVYQNSLDEAIQEISLESARSVVVKERLYDELGRQRITTQDVRIIRSKFEPLVAYYENFVTNDDLAEANSIWKTGRLEGLATKIIGHPYAFIETKYDNNPLNEKIAIGLPGKDFSTSGNFAKRFTSNTSNLFVANRYPLSMNVSYQVELKMGGVEDITVLNSDNKKIAHFVHVPGSKDLFSTSKLDKDGNILQVLPPVYFEKVGSFHKTNSELLAVDAEDYRLQQKLGVHVDYDSNGKPIRKTTADAGPLENVYDSEKLLRFTLYYSYSNPKLVETIIYFSYDQIGRLISTGQFLDNTVPKDQLLGIHIDDKNSRQYQLFNYATFERDPILRGRLLRSITMNNDEPFAEVAYVNERGDAVNKRIILPNLTKKPDQIIIAKQYVGGVLREITYPAEFLGQSFSVVYGYDRLGHVNSIGTPDDPDKFMRIAHNAAGQIVEQTYEPASAYTFKHQWVYNEPGFLTKLESPFQSEEISYTRSSYGGANRGDGSVTRIKFSSNWHGVASSSGVGLSPDSFINKSMSPKESRSCFEALKRAGYLDDKNRQVRAFYPELEIDFPITCTFGTTGRHVSNVLGRHGFPREHGYRFDYGVHQDLTKAKYFVGGDEPDPFQPDTFAREIAPISSKTSRRIWQALRTAQFLIEDPDRTNISTSHGKESPKQFVGSKLFKDLREVSGDYVSYAGPLRKLLASRYFKRQGNVPLIQLQDLIGKWLNRTSDTSVQRAAADIFEMLRQKRYFLDPLDREFATVLKEFEGHLPEIVRVLFTYFGRQLGRSEFDVESYEIGANGNHRMFNTGYDHYGLKYEQDSNRVEGVQYKAFDSPQPEEVFPMRHDSRGNVVQALHKGIQSMVYHPVSNLLQRVRMTDGNSVQFYYDSKGERVLKRVTDSNGRIRKEMHYLRDDQGRALVERELSFLVDNQPPAVLVTMYIYGANGLVGFIRRDQFHSVITDHQGSVRLIVRDGEVVAAYDYLPYGNLMRIFGADCEAHIPYRYTGQEWDPEIGLYNYHARFYDPSIGRFYQTDPKGQYFSPYKYAGNSPASMVDPSGEIALITIFALVSMVVGAYLGAAAANDTLEFWKWDLTNIDTYMGIIFGGMSGYFLPGGFMTTIPALGIYGYAANMVLGVGLAYLSAASANGSIDPKDWDFSSPRTWSALFDGFSMGGTTYASFKQLGQHYKKLDAVGRKVFVASSVVIGSGQFVMGGVATDWDLKKPQFWFATISSILSAPELAAFGANSWKASRNGWKKFRGNWKVASGNYKTYTDTFFRLHNQNGCSIRVALSEIFQKHSELRALANSAGTAASIGLATFAFGVALNHGFGNWSEVSTYQNVITAIQVGGQAGAAGAHAIRRKLIFNKSKKALKLTEEVAKKASNFYENLIKNEGAFSTLQETYSQNTKTKLKANKIPNTAMSVVVAGDIAIVGFSSNKAPGLYLVYDHDNLSSPTFRLQHIVDDNSQLAGSPVTVRDNSDQSDAIAAAIADIQNGIKASNIREYETDNLREVIIARAADSTADENITTRIANAIHDQIMEHGFADKFFIAEKLEQFHFANAPILEARAALGVVQNEAYTLNIEISDIIDKKLKAAARARLKELTGRKNKLSKEYERVLTAERKKYGERLYEKIKQFTERVTNWDIANCAEPHTLLALERQKLIWGEEIFTRRSYDIHQDIDYMSTFTTKNLKGFQRCDHCMVSTKLIRNVLTDNDFMHNLQQAIYKGKDRLQFLQPIVRLQQTIQEEVERTNNEERSKRSIESEWYKRPLQWIKGFKSIPSASDNPKSNNSFLELGDKFLSKINMNGTLLLADVILAKCQRRRIHQMPVRPEYRLDNAELLCNTLELFDKSLKKAAALSGMSLNELNVDSFTMQMEVMPLLQKHRFERINEIMLDYVMAALNESHAAERSIDDFRLAFKSLNLNESIAEMVLRMEQTPLGATAASTDMAYSYNISSTEENSFDSLGAPLHNHNFLN